MKTNEVVISKKPCSRCGSTMWHKKGQKFPEKLNICYGCSVRSELAASGGKARARSLSKKEKTVHARKMVAAREAKKLTPSSRGGINKGV